MASPQLGLGTGLGVYRKRSDKDSRQDLPQRSMSLGALHLGGMHVYCKNMHKRARAPREAVLTMSQKAAVRSHLGIPGLFYVMCTNAST